MPCTACQLPETLDELSHAFIWPPQEHTLAKIARHLEAEGFAYRTDKDQGFLALEVDNANRFLAALYDALTDAEAGDTRLLLSDNAEPSFGEFGNVASVERMIERKRGDWLIELLSEERYTSFRQPIVDLSNGDAPIGHEYLLRGYDRAGGMLSPAALFESARDPRISFNLDRAARLSAVATAADLPGTAKIFINFMPGSVYDPNVCLRTTVDAIAKAGIAPERVIFEIVESERVQDLVHLRGIVNFYRAAGFKIALDDYGSGFNNIETLMMLEPDYLKLDKVLIHQMATGGADKRDLVAMLAERCTKSGIRTIGEGVEDAATADILREIGVDYAQGYHFGRPLAPDAVRAGEETRAGA